MPPDPTLADWQVVVIYLGTIHCSALCVLVPFYLISRSDRLIDIFSRGGPIYLRFITVILVVWSVTLLAMMAQMTQGPSALFGTIIGYVFGVIRPSPPSSPPREG